MTITLTLTIPEATVVSAAMQFRRHLFGTGTEEWHHAAAVLQKLAEAEAALPPEPGSVLDLRSKGPEY